MQKSSFIASKSLSDDELDIFFAQQSVTIIGFGSLLSKTSAQTTFPNLQNFREVSIQGYIRVFQHPAFIFFERAIAKKDKCAYSSLSAEQSSTHSFMAVAFEISGQSKTDWLRREEEFQFDLVHYTGIFEEGYGLMCTSSENDNNYILRWGRDKYDYMLAKHDLPSIWNKRDHRNILPCSVYLRHCVLAAKKCSDACYESFLNDTYLADQQTTIRQYLEMHPEVMETLPPESLLGRYSG